MAEDKEPRRNSSERIKDALGQKGYREINHYQTRRFDRSGNRGAPCLGFTVYDNGKRQLILQEFKGGACELYRAVNESLLVDDVIASIPED